MTVRRRLNVALLCALALTGSSACASFSSGDYGDASIPRRDVASARRSIGIAYRMTSTTNGRGETPNPVVVSSVRDKALASYKSSGLFSEVSGAPENTDLIAEITFSREETFSPFLATLSGATLTALPARGTEEFQMVTVFKDREGKVLGTYRRNASIQIWIHATLIPLTPFLFPLSVQDRVHARLHEAILADALRAGAI